MRNLTFIHKLSFPLLLYFLLLFHKTSTTQPTDECEVQFKLNLAPIPTEQYKANPLSPHHAQAPILTVGMHQWVQLECTCCCDRDKVRRLASLASGFNLTVIDEQASNNVGHLQYRIVSTNGHVVVPTETEKAHVHIRGHHAPSSPKKSRSAVGCEMTGGCMELYKTPQCGPREKNDTRAALSADGFFMYADNLGQSDVSAHLIWSYMVSTNTTSDADNGGSSIRQSGRRRSKIHLVRERFRWPIAEARLLITDRQQGSGNSSGNWSMMGWKDNFTTISDDDDYWARSIRVTILLRPQKFYLASDWSASIIAFMIALSVGCCNDPVLFRAQCKKPKPLIIGLVCQLIMVPMFAFGLSLFCAELDQAFGLFLTANVPGGGLAYLLTYLVNGDRQLCAALSLLSSCLDVVTCPLWMITIGWYWFNRPIHIGKTMAWLLLITGAQCLGTLMRGCRPGLAMAVLTWITRPLLLLSGILLITLGVYINHYAFTEINQNLILCLLSLITVGFILGWLAGQVTKQGIAVSRTLATEAAVFNGLLCMPLLRTSLHAPEGDLTAVVSLWTIFLTPIPLAYHAVLSVLHHWLSDFLQRRKKHDEAPPITTGMLLTGPAGCSNGDVDNGMGIASVAAVAAAAMAVVPAITASQKDCNRTPRLNYNHDPFARNEALMMMLRPTADSSPLSDVYYSSETDGRRYNRPDNHVNQPIDTERRVVHRDASTSSADVLGGNALHVTSNHDATPKEETLTVKEPVPAPRKVDRCRPPPYTNL